MGFYVRQSVSAGPFRFTFSNAGLSVSAGVKGLRVGTGPRGSWVRMGSGGLSYRMSVSGNGTRPAGGPRPAAQPGSAPAPTPRHGGFAAVGSGDVMRMADASSAALLAEIQSRYRRARMAPWAGALAALALIVAAGNDAPSWALLLVLAAGVAAIVVAAQRDAVARTLVLMYELEPFAEAAYERLHQAFTALAGASATWSVRGRAGVWDQKRNAGATSLVQRHAVRLSVGSPPVVRSNLNVPVVPAGHETLYLFPDRVLVFTAAGVGAVPYQKLNVRVGATRFIEEGAVPRDARIVDHTWRYVNKGGGPDRRFKDNPQIPVALYEEVGLSSDAGLNVVLQLSRAGHGEAFRAALAGMATLPANPAPAPSAAPRAADAPRAAADASAHRAPAPTPARPAPEAASAPASESSPAPRAEGVPPTTLRLPDPAIVRPAADLSERPPEAPFGMLPPPSPPPPAPAAAPTPPPAVPAAPAADAAQAGSPRTAWRWVPPGVPVEFRGFSIAGGMFYAGSGLAAVASWRGTEPALVDPRLPLATAPGEIAVSRADYWPSYSGVSPGFRAKYLHWLADGRRHAGIDPGCVFLFFYGIERRLLIDAKEGRVSPAEVAALVAEVERLLGVYGGHASFRQYASAFLDLVRVRHGLEAPAAPPPAERSSFELPLALRIRLGRFAAAREPVPAEWALAWARLSPVVYLRTPAERCPAEFDAAFRHAYRARFGEGMTVKANRTKVTLTYRPASASFGGNTLRMPLEDVPDVGGLKAPNDRLAQVAEAAADAIDRYSRWVGRTGEGESLAALSLLPREVLRRRVRASTPPVLAEVAAAIQPAGLGTVPSSLLASHWPAAKPGRLAKREAEALAELFEKLGLGIAPDVRHTGINPSAAEHAAVFLLPAEAPAPGPDFAAATLLLTLGAAVAGADELAREEESEIERHLEAAYRLNDADRARLRAHLAWLRVCPPAVAGLKRQLEPLAPDARERIARALVAIAGADGHVSPAEVKMLTRVYPLLGLDAQRVYADVHALAAGHRPVTVIAADPAKEFAIPAPAADPRRAAPAFVLDAARIASIQRETHEVTRVLAGVFAADEAAEEGATAGAAVLAPAADSGDGEDPRSGAATCLPGLDEAHSALVRALGERTRVDRAELDRLAAGLGLMPGGAVETVNEAAFQLCDEPLLEDGDPVEINPYAREELFR